MDKMTAQLMHYIDGELSEADAALIAERLKVDEALQAEHLALKRVDRLLTEAPFASPSIDFTMMFEARLDQRLSQRRNILGLSIISLVLVMATGLLLWSLNASDLSLFDLLDSDQMVRNGVTWLQDTMVGLGIVAKVGLLMLETMGQLVVHPILWGLVCLVAGIVLLWAQLLRWVGVTRQPVAA